jgi:hypothetical protein
MTMHRHTSTVSRAPSAAAYAEELSAAWREARAESESAYRNWCEAHAAQRRLAYAVFLAAADRGAAAEQAFLLTTSHA